MTAVNEGLPIATGFFDKYPAIGRHPPPREYASFRGAICFPSSQGIPDKTAARDRFFWFGLGVNRWPTCNFPKSFASFSDTFCRSGLS